MTEAPDMERQRINTRIQDALALRGLTDRPMAEVLQMMEQPATLGQVIHLQLRVLDAILFVEEYVAAATQGRPIADKENTKAVRQYMTDTMDLLRYGLETLPVEKPDVL